VRSAVSDSAVHQVFLLGCSAVLFSYSRIKFVEIYINIYIYISQLSELLQFLYSYIMIYVVDSELWIFLRISKNHKVFLTLFI